MMYLRVLAPSSKKLEKTLVSPLKTFIEEDEMRVRASVVLVLLILSLSAVAQRRRLSRNRNIIPE